MNKEDCHKNKKRLCPGLVTLVIITCIISIISLVFACFANNFLWQQEKNTSSEPFYVISYFDDGIPGRQFDIALFTDHLLTVRVSSCSIPDCEAESSGPETHYFSGSNLSTAYAFIRDNFGTSSKELSLHRTDLTERQNSVLSALAFGDEALFEFVVEPAKFRIEYTPASNEYTYGIYLKADNSIYVKKVSMLNEYELGQVVDSYTVDFSDEHVNELYNFFLTLFNGEDSTVTSRWGDLRQDETKYFNAVINSDESLLGSYAPNLLYYISYQGINCKTPILYLYDNGTYEYFSTFGTDGNTPTPQTGSYTTNLSSIFDTELDENPLGFYTIVSAEEGYSTSLSNPVISALLDELGITDSFHSCLTQEGF